MSRKSNVRGEVSESRLESAAGVLHGALEAGLTAREEAKVANRRLAVRMDELHQAYGVYKKLLEDMYMGENIVSGNVKRVVQDKDGSWSLRDVVLTNERLVITDVHPPKLNVLVTDADEFMERPVELMARLPGEPASPDQAQMFHIVTYIGDDNIRPVAEQSTS